jgi:hypothetical protein
MMSKYLCLAAVIVFASCVQSQPQRNEPQPRVVDPGEPGKAPSDAIVLFGGSDMSQWIVAGGGPAKCDVRDAAMACTTGVGDIFSKETFRSAQIHVEFAIPSMPDHKGQLKGNSGVYIQGRYEIQVLDSYNNPTYPNGSAGALYGQYAPLVNASRAPEQWQTYDIIFRAPKCDAAGNVTERGRLTLLHNGVLVQDHVEIQKASGGGSGGACSPGPLMLQDHSGFKDAPLTVMRYRNIWFRHLE